VRQGGKAKKPTHSLVGLNWDVIVGALGSFCVESCVRQGGKAKKPTHSLVGLNCGPV